MLRSSPSASGPSCSAGPTGRARAGRSRPIPLGGYVKFLGDNDASSATPSDQPLSADQQRRAFFTQPLYARAAVVLGGPLANLLFALLLLTAVFYVAGEPYSPAIVAVQADGPGCPGGPAHRRPDRAPERQARRSLRRHPGHAVPLSRRPMAVEYRRGDAMLRGEIVAAILRADRQVRQQDALRRARPRPAHSSRGRWLHGQQPRRSRRPEGRRPAAGDRRQAGRSLHAHPRADRQQRRPSGEGQVRSRRAASTRPP